MNRPRVGMVVDESELEPEAILGPRPAVGTVISESDLEPDDAEPRPDFSVKTTADPQALDRALSDAEARSTEVLGAPASKAMRTYLDVGVGAAKGLGQGVVDIARVPHMVPGVTRFTDWMYGKGSTDRAFSEADALLAGSNTAQKAGKVGSQVAQAVVPSNAISRLGLTLASKAPKGLQLATRAATEAAGAAGIATAQNTDAGVAAGVAGAVPFAGKALQGASRALRSGNPAINEAVEFGMRRGIPLDAATATDNPAVRGAQFLADRSIGGSVIGASRNRAREGALARVGNDLAAEAHPSPVVPEQAGQAIRDAVEGRVTQSHDDANRAYGDLRQIEALPSSRQTVQTGTRKVDTGVLDASGQPVSRMEPITADVELPVDMRTVKQALGPVAERMRRQLPITQQRSSPGLKAIENILAGEDFVPASVADMDLSAIKSISREAGMPQLRDVSQGLAARAVNELETAVQQAVAQGGAAATSARTAGRQATVAKYGAADLLKQIREEPVQAFNQTIWQKDSGIDRLREIAKIAPQEMPKLGRAYLEDVLGGATAEGGFNGAQGIWKKWQNLGPETKKLLYPDATLRSDLDSFFLLAKKSAENPNPSGTAYVASLFGQGGLVVASPLYGVSMTIGSAALSAMLHSPRTVRLLTQGLRTSTSNEAAAGAVAAQIMKAASAAPAGSEGRSRPGAGDALGLKPKPRFGELLKPRATPQATDRPTSGSRR